MQLPSPKDAIHKAWLYRVLSALCDDLEIASVLCFKGGICASMLGWLDRFSVDLDFDFVGGKDEMPAIRKRMEKVFRDLGLIIKDKIQQVPQYFLKYGNQEGERNSLKIDVTFPPPKANQYQAQRIASIDRIINCQTIETMFANKLVAMMERYQKTQAIAGRDLYDIHYFFLTGQRYNEKVIQERTGKTPSLFLQELSDFIEEKVTDKIITEDLNSLLPYAKFKVMRKVLKQETLMFLNDEIKS